MRTTGRQALVPDNCTVLANHTGTAPGMLFEQEWKDHRLHARSPVTR
ncbi:MAG: hypothetical protein MZV63_22390 [Marinilabiliales bacterium]|nr:hypothetical protein [Marinilabiliales bacterium]